MAFKIIVFVSFIVAANAGFVWQDDEPRAGQRFPTFPNFPYMPLPHFPQFRMPIMPPFPKIPSVADMKNIVPGPNENFNGVAARSSSSMSRDQDGKIVKTGGTSVMFNNNGETEEIKRGDNPPNLDDPFFMPPMPVFEPIIIPPMVPFEPIDIANYVPGDNENFVGASSFSSSHSSNINGVKSSGGETRRQVNINGEVDQEGVKFGQHDKPK